MSVAVSGQEPQRSSLVIETRSRQGKICMHKNELLQRIPDVDIKIRANTDIELIVQGNAFPGDDYTLALLDVFATPMTLEAGLEVLQSRIKGPESWFELTAQAIKLHEFGALINPGQQKPVSYSHPDQFYAPPVHIRMLNDRNRTHSYQKVIREIVTPADLVLDLGTGTGIMAATAAMAGAKHVYAIERSMMAKLARQVFEVNGLSDRITLIEGTSTQVELPEKADVMVSELVGNDPLQEGILIATADAVKRHLKPQARLIPETLKIYGLPVAVPPEILREEIFTPEAVKNWQEWYGIDFSPLLQAVQEQEHSLLVNLYKTRKWLTLSDPVLLTELDLKTSQHAVIRTSHQVRARNSGVLTGILIYFELNLGKTVRLSTHPLETTPENHWGGKVCIPSEPLPLDAGDWFDLNYSFGKAGSTFKLQKGLKSVENSKAGAR